VDLDLTTDVPVLRIAGRLDRGAIRPCREALDRARLSAEPYVIVDLGGVTASAHDTIPLLGAMRRYLAVGGVGMTLVRVPSSLEAAMRSLGVWDLYDVVAAPRRS
jgi:anti-anti-sigma regulatory factor